MTKLLLPKRRGRENNADCVPLTLPHEHDETTNTDPIETRPIVRQAYSDLMRGLVDTDMHGDRGVEGVLKSKTTIKVKKRRHIVK